MTKDELDKLKTKLLNLGWRDLRALRKSFKARNDDNGIQLINQVLRTKGKLQQQAKKQPKVVEKGPGIRCYICHQEMDESEGTPFKQNYCRRCIQYLKTANSDDLKYMKKRYEDLSVMFAVIEESAKSKLH